MSDLVKMEAKDIMIITFEKINQMKMKYMIHVDPVSF